MPVVYQQCMASYFHSRGPEIAAHRTLPFGTRVLVENLDNGRSAHMVIRDRGPFIRGRCIDVSLSKAQALGMIGAGVARVVVYLE